MSTSPMTGSSQPSPHSDRPHAPFTHSARSSPPQRVPSGRCGHASLGATHCRPSMVPSTHTVPAGGATAKVHIHRWYDVTVNDPALTDWSIPTLGRMAGEENVQVVDKVCGAEDFSFFQKEVPGLFYRLGCTPPTTKINDSAPGHSPRFYLDENCLKLGVKLQCSLALDWLSQNS